MTAPVRIARVYDAPGAEEGVRLTLTTASTDLEHSEAAVLAEVVRSR